MFAKKVSVYADLKRRERPNCISEKCIKRSPKRKVGCSNHLGNAKNSAGNLSKIKGFRRFFIFTKKQQKRKNHKFSLANSLSANGGKNRAKNPANGQGGRYPVNSFIFQ